VKSETDNIRWEEKALYEAAKKRGIPVLFTGKYYVGSASNGSKVFSDTEIIELRRKFIAWNLSFIDVLS